MSSPVYVVTVRCTVTEPELLEKEARRLAEESGISPADFDEHRAKADPVEYDLGWVFDHGSPTELGIQIEDSNVEAES